MAGHKKNAITKNKNKHNEVEKKGRNTHHLRMHDVGIMGIMGAGNGSREGSHRLGGRATSLDRHGPKRIQEGASHHPATSEGIAARKEKRRE